MDQKYSADHVFFLATTHYFLESESRKNSGSNPISFFGGNVPSHEYRIFIKLKFDENRCYQITAEENHSALLFQGNCAGSNWRLIQNPEELYEHREDLGKVIIQKRAMTISDFEDYDSFWELLKRGD